MPPLNLQGQDIDCFVSTHCEEGPLETVGKRQESADAGAVRLIANHPTDPGFYSKSVLRGREPHTGFQKVMAVIG